MIAIVEEPNWDFTPGAERAAMLLGFRAPQAMAAEVAGVSARTIRRWLASPLFQQRVASYRAHNVAMLGELIDALQVRSAERLAELVESEDERIALGAVRLTLVDVGPNLRAETHLLRRLAALEQTAAAVELAEQEDQRRNATSREFR
jgi:hypothetical protein